VEGQDSNNSRPDDFAGSSAAIVEARGGIRCRPQLRAEYGRSAAAVNSSPSPEHEFHGTAFEYFVTKTSAGFLTNSGMVTGRRRTATRLRRQLVEVWIPKLYTAVTGPLFFATRISPESGPGGLLQTFPPTRCVTGFSAALTAYFTRTRRAPVLEMRFTIRSQQYGEARWFENVSRNVIPLSGGRCVKIQALIPRQLAREFLTTGPVLPRIR